MTGGAKIAGTPKFWEKHEFKAGDGVGAPCGRIDCDVSIHSCGLQCASGGQNAPPQQNTLTVMGGREATMIPRAFSADDPNGDKKLDKAHSQEKHAPDMLGKMNKPANFTDQQIAEFKAGESAEADSGLGHVYFRREKYDNFSKELQTAVAGEANRDQTDLFVLGADCENLRQFKEAVDIFNRCAQIAGPMQDRCKQLASSALKQAAGTN